MEKEIKTKITKDILIFQLGERYNAMHIIRERAQSTSIWMFGLFATGAGWLIQSKSVLNDTQKMFLSIIVVIFYLAVRFYYLRDLNKGFISQQKTSVRIENELGLFDKDNPILPREWKNSGKKKSNGNFFNSIFIMVGLGTAILLLGILIQGRL